jgi:hypothetical protein
MLYLKLLNPFYLYRVRKLIIPYLMRPLALRGIVLLENDKELVKYRDRYLGERCFIIGNGPSLRISDLERLKDEITFASNKIYLAFDQTAWRPTYYASEDSMFIRNHIDILGDLENTVKFFPISARKYNPPLNNSVFFHLKMEDFYPHLPCFSHNALKGIYWGSTVTYTLLQIACYMGFRKMYLVGVDFNYRIPEKTQEELESNNRVISPVKPGKIYTSIGEKNYFHPDYVVPGERNFVPNLSFHKRAYLSADANLKRIGGRIFNASRGGALEVFSHVDFDTLFPSHDRNHKGNEYVD